MPTKERLSERPYWIEDLASRLKISEKAAREFYSRIGGRGIGIVRGRRVHLSKDELERAIRIYQAGDKYHGSGAQR